ncbi:MAG TPA: translation initiation factor [Lentimicrobium sp.]|nr:translation initiation factor [Lentimicrobium sp.]
MSAGKSKNKRPEGVVYSTNPNFTYDFGVEQEQETLPPAQQNLRVMLDRKLKGGKKATLITGFYGSSSDLDALAKQLKNLCAAGGTSGNGEILVQGDFRQKILEYLLKKGYKAKPAGG